jgi:hypothetical protein
MKANSQAIEWLCKQIVGNSMVMQTNDQVNK